MNGTEWVLDERGALRQTRFTRWPLVARGKVREMYDLGDRLLIVATDRISAFDWVLPTAIPDKGRVLTRLSAFWFRRLEALVPTHLLSTDVTADPAVPRAYHEILRGRTMLALRAQVFPVECVVRGYLAGSGWRDYCRTGAVCGIPLPPGLVQAARLPEPIFTPATKAATGHDENIEFARMAALVGEETAAELRRLSLLLYGAGATYAESRGILVADTKFEFGRRDGRILLVDEALTPDSSRFWPAEEYAPGSSPPSFDKQFVRDWLEATSWDKASPPPALPDEVVAQTRARYLAALERLTGERLD